LFQFFWVFAVNLSNHTGDIYAESVENLITEVQSISSDLLYISKFYWRSFKKDVETLIESVFIKMGFNILLVI